MAISARLRSLAFLASRIGASLVLYDILARSLSRPAFPRLVEIGTTVMEGFFSEIAPSLGYTLLRWGICFAVGIVVGVCLGVILGWGPIGRSFLSAEINFVRSIPSVVLLFFVMAAFGDSEATRNFPTVFVTALLITFHVGDHTANISRRRIEHLQLLNAPLTTILRCCIGYELLSSISLSIRQAVSISFLVQISTELIVGSQNAKGLGHLFITVSYEFDYAKIILAIIVVGFVGYILNLITDEVVNRSSVRLGLR